MTLLQRDEMKPGVFIAAMGTCVRYRIGIIRDYLPLRDSHDGIRSFAGSSGFPGAPVNSEPEACRRNGKNDGKDTEIAFRQLGCFHAGPRNLTLFHDKENRNSAP